MSREKTPWKSTRLLALLLVPILLTSWAPARLLAEPFAFVANSASDDVTVIDVATDSVVATIGVGNLPSDIVASPDGSRVYVADDQVSVIDVQLLMLQSSNPIGIDPTSLALSPSGNTLYAIDAAGQLLALDASSFAVLDSLAGPPLSTGITVHPDGSRLYITTDNFGTGLFVIETATLTVVQNVLMGFGEFDAAIDGSAGRLYVAGVGESSFVDIATFAVTVFLTNPGLNLYRGLAISPDSSRVYISFINSVEVIDTGTLLLLGSIPVGANPRELAFDPSGTRLYVTNSADDTVSVIDPATDLVTATLTVGDSPRDIAIAPLFVPPVSEIPVMGGWGQMALALLLAGFGLYATTRRRRVEQGRR